MRSSPISAAKFGILVPASQARGLGHFYRTFGLYERIAGSLYFSHDSLIEKLCDRSVVLPPETRGVALVDAIAANGVKALYVDHYWLDAETLQALSEQKKFATLFFDRDFRDPPFSALVNSNPFAAPACYSSLARNKKYFLGAEYYVFRQQIAEVKKNARQSSRTFICFGGSDPLDLSFRVLEHLSPGEEFFLALGAGVDKAQAEKIEREIKRLNLKMKVFVDPPDFFALMASCGQALLSCSTVAYEAIYLGLSVACLVVAENQEKLASYLNGEGVDVRDARSKPDLATAFRYSRPKIQFGSKQSELISYIESTL